MNYTNSDAYVVHPATGNRMHQGTDPITTQVSAIDMNQTAWSMMEIIKAAGLTGMTFDPDAPATYQRLLTALNTLYPGKATTPTTSSMTAAISAAIASYGITAPVSGDFSPTKHFWAKVRANQSDVRVMVVGDSTGNGADEWVYLTAQWLATQCPAHTIKYRLWGSGDGSTQVWGSHSTIQTGTGPTPPDADTNTIWVDNASVSGINTFYFHGAREPLVWDGSVPDLVISNFGHNLGTGATEEIALPEWVAHLSHLRLLAPQASILVTLQNPRSSTGSDINTNGSAASARMTLAWRKAADLFGTGVIDVYTAFRTHANYASLMADETHPSPAGSAVWVTEVKRALAEPRRLDGALPPVLSPLTVVRPNFAPNPRFSRWTGVTPDGWTFTNCTPVKNVGVTDGTLYSMEVQTGAGTNPWITADLSSLLPKLRGKTVSLAVRLWRPVGLGLLAGRIAIETTDNTTNPAFTSYPRGAACTGGWEWAFATLAIGRTPNPTALTLRIYAGAADGSDNGKKFYVDSIWFGEGALPGAVGVDDASLKLIGDLYSDGNVGRFAGNTGTLTAAGGVVTLTGSPTTASDTYINLPGIVSGTTYKVAFRPVSAAGNTAGGCYMRNGIDGGVTDLAKASGTGDWVAAGGTVSFTFVAPAGPVSIRPYGYTGTTGYVMDQWTITEVVAAVSQMPQNSQSANYTLIGSDAGKHLLHPAADTTARTFTIPANAAVAFPLGSVLTFVNQASAGVISIAITADTMRLAGAGTTGTRSLAANGVATALKVTATEWIIYGTGLT